MPTLSNVPTRAAPALPVAGRDELLAAQIKGTPLPEQRAVEVRVRRPYQEHAETVLVDLNKLRRLGYRLGQGGAA
jgi:hypothetical protein